VHGQAVRRERDAHHDRVLILSTAETHPAGSFYLTSYEIILLQLGYAVSETTQISVTTTPPLGESATILADFSLKNVLVRQPRFSVAAIASASGIIGVDEFNGFLGRAGGVVTLCADAAACNLSFTFGTNLALAGPASLWFNGVGVTYRLSKLVTLLAEVDTLVPLSELVGEANGMLGGAGVRLSGLAWGVDMALLGAGKAGGDPSPVIPFIAASYRVVP
jgi:hypothetical protein